MEILIITGMSGAGKTSVLNLCQDNEYYCIDNMPPELIKHFLYLVERSNVQYNKLAFVVDVRSAVFNKELLNEINDLKKSYTVKIVFIDASDDTLIKRYKEKRRPHPIKGLTIENALKEERKYLKQIAKKADYYIDTSEYSLPRLKNMIESALFGCKDFSIQIVSFGFKYGILSEADLVFDVRFTTNPFYIPELKSLNGLDQAVKEYVLEDKMVITFINKVENLIREFSPYYQKEGKSNLVIGIGCTGGQHRSPAIAEELKNRLEKDFSIGVFHRESNMW
ncbi:MAG: RNase adapter RapZ [Tissierellia bacterium]|nr:RNase adapter RapZ [Tissierellia bacterium]